MRRWRPCCGSEEKTVGDLMVGAGKRDYARTWNMGGVHGCIGDCPTRVLGAPHGPCSGDHTNSARNRHVPGVSTSPVAHARTQMVHLRKTCLPGQAYVLI